MSASRLEKVPFALEEVMPAPRDATEENWGNNDENSQSTWKKKIKEKENQNNVYVWKKKCNLLNKMEPPKNTKEKNAADLWICVENVICLRA